MKKINEKGFTLIELISAILIIAILVVITGRAISDSMKTSKEKAVELTQQNLYTAATLYTTEFKTSSSDWYVEYKDDGTSLKETGNEYSCTTIQMLINKGLLSNNLVSPDTQQPINKNIFIKIIRNIDTKAYAAEVDSKSEDCGEYDSEMPSATFSPSTEPLADNWYNSAFVMNITPTAGKSGVENIEYYIKGSSDHKTHSGSETVSLNVSGDKTNVQICAITTNRIGVIGDEVCSDKYNIDTTAPKIYNQASKVGSGVVTFNISDNSLSKGVNYCVTKSTDSSICSWNNTTLSSVSANVNEGSGTYNIYVKDFVGNIANATVEVTVQKTATATCTTSSTGTSCSTSKNISDLGSIFKITSDQGSVSYSQSGTTINLNFSGGTAKSGSGTSCNCTTSSYACNCSSYSCGCSSYSCNCKTSSYQCNCTTSSYQCNCTTSSYQCNCKTSSYQCNCNSSQCNCTTSSYSCNCKTTSYSCCKHSTRVCSFGSCWDTCTQNGTCSKQTCSTCSSQSCSTCQSCNTCSSCKTCSSTSCSTCYTYEYTATITYVPIS